MTHSAITSRLKTMLILCASFAGLAFAAGTAAAQETGAGYTSNWGAPGPAQRTGLYVEAGPTYHEFEGDNGLNAHAWAATGRVGWQFLPMLSVEGEASFGVDDGDFDFRASEEDFSLDDNSDGDVADIISSPGNFGLNYLIGAYLRLSYPVTPQFEVFARGGYAHADVDSTVSTPGGARLKLADSEDGASYGGGAAWHFANNQAIRADFTYTDFDFAEDNAYGLTYQFKF